MLRAAAFTPLAVALLVTSLAGVASLTLPAQWAADAVGATFFAATYWLVLRHEGDVVRRHGLTLGGLFDSRPLTAGNMLWASARASLWALAAAALLFPPFVLGYLHYWQPTQPFQPGLPPEFLGQAVTQVFAIALPEEMFYRGYLQSQLTRVWPPRRRVFGGSLGPDVWVTSLVFAVGHVLTIPSAARLSVFFPSLIFGWLRSRTGGIGASVLFHALCNLLTLYLSHGYGSRH